MDPLGGESVSYPPPFTKKQKTSRTALALTFTPNGYSDFLKLENYFTGIKKPDY
jgi:hypothetical protein